MARNISFDNLTIGYNDTATKESCLPYPRSAFETVNSSVPYIVNAALNVALSITTTIANLLVLLAMRHITSIRLPSKLLLCSLVLTDFGTGLVVQPQRAAFLLMKTADYYNAISICFLLESIYFTTTVFSNVSLLTMTAISLDRYIALFYHLRYHEIVTTRRVCVFLTFTWLFSLVFASVWSWNYVLGTIIAIAIFIICLFVISVAYIKIYRGLRGQHGHHVQVQLPHVQAQQQAGSTFNMATYKRTASAMLWVYALFILCFVPFICAYLIIVAFEHNVFTQCIYEFSVTLMLVNSCLNPFVYCLRLPEIRAEVVKQLRKCCCQSPQQ